MSRRRWSSGCLCTQCAYCSCLFFFFFNDTATTEIYTLSLHDALPILDAQQPIRLRVPDDLDEPFNLTHRDRKSTRLNSSHLVISYAVFCLKKKKARHSRESADRGGVVLYMRAP